MQYLELISCALRPCGAMAMLYLAAAVSDFFVPWSDMVSVIVDGAHHMRDTLLLASCNGVKYKLEVFDVLKVSFLSVSIRRSTRFSRLAAPCTSPCSGCQKLWALCAPNGPRRPWWSRSN